MTQKFNGTALPIRNLKGLSLIDVPAINKISIEELKDRINTADIFLPSWSVEGIRNQMAQTGVCVGLVSPRSPINPLSKTQREEFEAEEEERKSSLEIIGSIMRMTLVIIKPAIPKDELEAYTLRLVHQACEDSDDPATIPMLRKDCQAVAVSRLMNKTPVTIQFNDLVIDSASQTVLTNVSSKHYSRVITLLGHIFTGRHFGVAEDLLENTEKQENSENSDNLPSRVCSVGSVYNNMGNTDKAKIDNLFSSDVFKKFRKIYGMELKETCDRLGISSKKDGSVAASDFFPNVLRGILMLTGLNTEWDKHTSKIRAKLVSGRYEGEVLTRVTRSLELNEYILDMVEKIETSPAIIRAVIGEPGKASFNIPFYVDSSQKGTLHSIARDALFNLYKTYAIGGETSINKLELEFSYHDFDVYADVTGKKAYIRTTSPASPDKRIIPMQVGVEYVDLLDRIGSTVSVIKDISSELRQLCELGFIFNHVILDLFAVKEG